MQGSISKKHVLHITNRLTDAASAHPSAIAFQTSYSDTYIREHCVFIVKLQRDNKPHTQLRQVEPSSYI